MGHGHGHGMEQSAGKHEENNERTAGAVDQSAKPGEAISSKQDNAIARSAGDKAAAASGQGLPNQEVEATKPENSLSQFLNGVTHAVEQGAHNALELINGPVPGESHSPLLPTMSVIDEKLHYGTPLSRAQERMSEVNADGDSIASNKFKQAREEVAALENANRKMAEQKLGKDRVSNGLADGEPLPDYTGQLNPKELPPK